MADTRFDLCLTHVLQLEGGYVDHPADPGGATNMGITRKTLARWRKVSPWWNLPKSEVQRLTRSEAGRIYRALYWTACKASNLPPGVDLVVFDYAVNSGPARAVKALQTELGVVVDGIVGPLTLGAAARADRGALINGICDRRLGFLRGLSTFSTFGRGWTSRVAAVRKAALAFAPGSHVQQRGVMTMDILSGKKTYIVAAIMLLVGLTQMLGFELPVMEGSSPGNLMLEALAILFLRRGLKGDIGRA